MVELEAAFLTVKNSKDLTALLKLMFTSAEIKMYRKRWQAMQMSAAGETQLRISEILHIGLTTATRSAKAARENRSTIQRILHCVGAQG
jgi:uncharacterized protein YerC